MSLSIAEKICIVRDGKIISGYDVCSIEKVCIDEKETDNIFRTMKSGGHYNLVKVLEDDTIKETNFKDCKGISDFDEDGMAKILFYDVNNTGKYSVNYIDTDLNLLFEQDKYVEIEKVSGGAFKTKFIVAIKKVTVEGMNIKSQKLFGVINKNGTEILECKYSSITYIPNTDTFETGI